MPKWVLWDRLAPTTDLLCCPVKHFLPLQEHQYLSSRPNWELQRKIYINLCISCNKSIGTTFSKRKRDRVVWSIRVLITLVLLASITDDKVLPVPSLKPLDDKLSWPLCRACLSMAAWTPPGLSCLWFLNPALGSNPGLLLAAISSEINIPTNDRDFDPKLLGRRLGNGSALDLKMQPEVSLKGIPSSASGRGWKMGDDKAPDKQWGGWRWSASQRPLAPDDFWRSLREEDTGCPELLPLPAGSLEGLSLDSS